MGVKEHLKATKLVVQILACEPSQSLIQGTIKDGTTIHIMTWDSSIVKRWPIVGEYWSVYREGQFFVLGSPVEDTTIDANSITSLEPGDVRIDAPTGRILVVTDEGSFLLGATHTHTQETPASVWIITHNLNKIPNIITTNDDNERIQGAEVYTSENVVTITFPGAESGKAYLS